MKSHNGRPKPKAYTGNSPCQCAVTMAYGRSYGCEIVPKHTITNQIHICSVHLRYLQRHGYLWIIDSNGNHSRHIWQDLQDDIASRIEKKDNAIEARRLIFQLTRAHEVLSAHYKISIDELKKRLKKRSDYARATRARTYR